jgi:CubicO group peptidase (beta-lactamase class C family)
MAAFDGVVMISVGDATVYRQAFGKADYSHDIPMTPDAVFRIASLSKQVTQAAVGRLVDRGAFGLDTTLAEFLPGFRRARDITIRQLIDHTAGLAHTNRLDWMDMRLTYTLDEIVDRLRREPLLFEPGEDRQYSNGGYALLARIIEIASDMSYAEFIDTEFTRQGFPTLGHEDAYAVVPGMVTRYGPGPVYGERVLADTYMTVNRIGGGSLYASANDVSRFFRASFGGDLVSPEMTAALFPEPEDGDIQITGRSPGALAQVYLDFDEDLAVITLSSNSAWPGSFNSDVVALFRGEDASLTGFSVDDAPITDAERAAVTGDFVADRFGWEWTIVPQGDQFAIRRNELHTAFVRTTEGEFHAPIYDWLCRYSDYGMEFECRQRDPDADIRFRFTRR